jgi:hypothetical protein
VGARLTVSHEDGFADDILSPGEFVDVPFIICIRQQQPFIFVVNVLAEQTAGKGIIQLVSARDQIEGGFVGNKAVYADEQRIYLASFQGKLFVLARDRLANFPLLEIIQDTTSPLTAVRGDPENLYVTSGDGNLRIYRKDNPLVLVDTIPLSDFGLSSLDLQQGNIYVSRGQAALAVDKDHVYLSELNEGDISIEISETLTPGLVYGQTFEQNTTVIFDRRNGERIVGIANPHDTRGLPSAVRLYVDEKILVQTIAGCCGSGIFIYDLKTFMFDQRIVRLFTNTVARSGPWLIAGNENGRVDLFDLRQNPSPLISSVDLRQLTGHTGREDIEIRALWIDKLDNLIFAGSSWGNDQSRGPTLPSFFVLELL